MNRHQCTHHTQTDKKCPKCLYKCTKNRTNVQIHTNRGRATRGTTKDQSINGPRLGGRAHTGTRRARPCPRGGRSPGARSAGARARSRTTRRAPPGKPQNHQISQSFSHVIPCTLSGRRTCRINFDPRDILTVPISHPLPGIPMHVVEPKRIRSSLPRLLHLLSIVCVPRIVL